MWVEPLERNLGQLHATLEELHRSAADRPERVVLLGKIDAAYTRWLRKCLAAMTSAREERTVIRAPSALDVTEAHETHLLLDEMAVSRKSQNEKLNALKRVKSDCVATVSHELRTPLTAIKGSIGLILGGVTGDIPKDAKELLDITQKNTDRLIRLINEVLDVA